MTARLPSAWSRPMSAAVTYLTPAGAAGTLATNGAGVQNAVQAFTVRWGRPAGYAYPNPGTVGLTVEHDASVPALPYGTRLTLTLTDAGQTVTAAVAWLVSYSRRAISGGRQLTTITAEDAFARAANTLLAATPWPAQTANERLAAINAASPIGPLLDLAGLYVDSTAYEQPRDVDSIAALDVIRRTLPFGWSLAETAAGLLRPIPQEGSILAWTGSVLSPDRWLSIASPLLLPLDSVEDPREAILDRAGLMTHCTVEFQEVQPGGVYPGTAVTYTAAGPTAGLYTAAVFSTATDIATLVPPIGFLWEQATSRAELLADANAVPVERWPAQRIALSRLTPALALALANITRHSVGLVTLGQLGGPTYQILAGRLEYRQGMAALTVELADARQALVIPLEFAMVPSKNVDVNLPSAARPQLMEDCGSITFLETATVGNLEDWRLYI